MSSIKLKHSGGNSVSINPPTSAPTSTEVAFKLPNADGSSGQFMKTDGSGNLSFAAVPADGITMTDIWYVSSSFTGSAAPISSNWAQYGLHNSGTIGGSMTQSSGIFTFPSTGIYRISWWTQAYRSGSGVNYSKVMLETTTNNSSYSTIPSGYTSFNSNNTGGGWYGTMSAEHFVDISDVSNTKVRFQAEQETTGATMEQVFVYFIRLGDT